MAGKITKGGPLEEFREKPVFHLAIAVPDLDAARLFYVDTLGCQIGRRGDGWLELNFFGYPITARRVPARPAGAGSPPPGDEVSLPHFGLTMNWEDWHRAVDHLNYIGVRFLVAPHIRCKAQPDEHAVFFLRDPGGNCLEFRAFKDPVAARSMR